MYLSVSWNPNLQHGTLGSPQCMYTLPPLSSPNALVNGQSPDQVLSFPTKPTNRVLGLVTYKASTLPSDNPSPSKLLTLQQLQYSGKAPTSLPARAFLLFLSLPFACAVSGLLTFLVPFLESSNSFLDVTLDYLNFELLHLPPLPPPPSP